jgi:hypothetical protein
MNQTNPTEVISAPSADPASSLAKRPKLVTIALAVLWAVVALTALATFSHLRMLERPIDPLTWGYVAYAIGLVTVPSFLLIFVAQARNWARFAILILYVLNFKFRIYLLLNDGVFTVPAVGGVLVPAVLQSVALLFLFLPRSGHWFLVRPNTSLERTHGR